MSLNKNNSLLTIVTLGVYLGLLLAGGAPQALGQAALTKQFDVKDEIEFKDELDNKPDDAADFLDEVFTLIRNLDGLAKEKKFDWTANNDLAIEGFGICESDESDSYLGFYSANIGDAPRIQFNRAGVAIAKELIEQKVAANAGTKYADWREGVDVRLQTDGSLITFTAKVRANDPTAAGQLGAIISAAVANRTSARIVSGPQILAEKTTSEVDDVAVILVTRLARSDLDALLTAKA
ncbi:MAG: hypothetical protein HS105_11550 [Chloracidobacterium sp.]|nr:hypothetical protein [Chloracidobacterium sp.]MCO5334256.1 hypothetical protein [Pyrinomonadaceae bacterium]